tara:strand:+ start:416 stop:622 length:207 start_codon:yes stop_codon:yes gene_type:complete
MTKKELECQQCGETYLDYKIKHWYDEEMCEVCNEEYSVNSCGFCGEELDEDGYYCSSECSKADNTEGV